MNMKKNENIEDLFKEKFEDFEAEVNPSVWSNVQTALKGAGLGLLLKTLINKLGTNTIVAVVSSAATVVSTVLIMHWTGNSEKTSANKTEPKGVKTETAAPVKEETTQPAQTNTVESKENVVTPAVVKNNKETVKDVKNNKKETEAEAKEFARKKVAFISPSIVKGSIPLIVNFENIGNGKINRWDFGDGKSEKNNPNPVHLYDTPGIYTVLLYSKNTDGVAAVDTVTIEVYGNPSIPVQPSMFSPNGDGVNDLFEFQLIDIAKADVTIVDVDGVIVYNCGVGCKWDGKDMKGKDVRIGKYYYMIKATALDGKKLEKKGVVNLTR